METGKRVGKTNIAPSANGAGRLVEIDIVRGLAVGLMGMTHGLMWVYLRPVWADHIKYAGIYFCYTAFVLTFGMSLAISALRGGLDTSARRLRTMKRAGVILLAYYLVACGRYLPATLHGGLKAVMIESLRLLVLLDIPSAGEFLLSFVLFMLLVACLGARMRALLHRPARLLALAFAGYGVGQALGTRAVAPALTSYWHLIFGARPGESRPFPLLPYLPLFAAGLLIGRFYFGSPDRMRWARCCLPMCALVFAAVGGVSRFVSLRNPAHWARFEPVPGYGFLLASGALACAVFALCVLWGGKPDRRFARAIPRFPVYLGRNSIWIIVWQYVCIQAIARRVVYAHLSDPEVVTYLVSMTILPPTLLACLQQIGRRIEWRANNFPKLSSK